MFADYFLNDTKLISLLKVDLHFTNFEINFGEFRSAENNVCCKPFLHLRWIFLKILGMLFKSVCNFQEIMSL